jgi:hypothetical protein
MASPIVVVGNAFVDGATDTWAVSNSIESRIATAGSDKPCRLFTDNNQSSKAIYIETIEESIELVPPGAGDSSEELRLRL